MKKAPSGALIFINFIFGVSNYFTARKSNWNEFKFQRGAISCPLFR